jgi:hypothetical protein
MLPEDIEVGFRVKATAEPSSVTAVTNMGEVT